MPRRAPLTLALLLLAFAAPSAQAAVITREGDTIFVRPDFDELLKDVEITNDGSTFTLASRTVVDAIGTPHAGAGCDASGAPKCAINGATQLTVDLGEGDQEATVTDSPIPVAVLGGTGRDRLQVDGAPSASIHGDAGDDILKVNATQANLEGGDDDDTLEILGGKAIADGGNGDDTFEATDALAGLVGGPGNDTFLTASRSPKEQTIDCGDGSDSATIDRADKLGDGCGPAFSSLSKSRTLGRWSSTGAITLATLLKAPKAASAKIAVKAKGVSASGSAKLKAGARLAPTLKRSSKLAKRRTPVTDAQVTVQLFAPGKTTGDTTLVTLSGTLRPR